MRASHGARPCGTRFVAFASGTYLANPKEHNDFLRSGPTTALARSSHFGPSPNPATTTPGVAATVRMIWWTSSTTPWTLWWPPPLSVWGSTSPTCGSWRTTRCRPRSRRTTRRRAVPGVTASRDCASSSRRRMTGAPTSGSSAAPFRIAHWWNARTCGCRRRISTRRIVRFSPIDPGTMGCPSPCSASIRNVPTAADRSRVAVTADSRRRR